MSGDLTVIGNVESKVDENGTRWFALEQIVAMLQALTLPGVTSTTSDNWLLRTLNEALKIIRKRYVKPEEVLTPDGRSSLRWWVTEPGIHQFAGRWDSPATEKFQTWLWEELVPSVRKTGRYEISQSSGDPIADTADLISRQALEIKKLRIEQIEIDKKAEEAKKIALASSEKVDEAVRRLDEMTGGNLYMTSRLACLKCGINPEEKYNGGQTKAMALGSWCKAELIRRGIKVAPKIVEGTMFVNQFPKDILRDGIRYFGWITRLAR